MGADWRDQDGFNTCSSCEEQPGKPVKRAAQIRFNTCSSCEEQPFDMLGKSVDQTVSIPAPLARSNEKWTEEKVLSIGFQYLLLLRGATPFLFVFFPLSAFQYLLLLRGATENKEMENDER